MSRSCIVLTTDVQYLFPTLAAAITARKHSDRATTDVIVFCFGSEDKSLQGFKDAFGLEGLELSLQNSRIIDEASPMLARLFLTRFVPSEYDDLLYLDGDIIVDGSLDPLLRVSIGDGCFLAANDPISFMVAEETHEGESQRTRMQQFGICGEMAHSYFNSGVLRISRNGWAETGKKAWDFYCRHKGRSRFPDQDALNYAGSRNRLPMSMTWNFPIFLRNANLDQALQPRITHYMSSPKPWHGNFAPWNSTSHKLYRELLARYPMLAPYVDRLSPLRVLKYHLQQRYKQLAESWQWGQSNRRTNILQYEQLCYPIPDLTASTRTGLA